jgi:hypothetical protein
MWHEWGRRDIYKVFMANPEGHCLGKLGIDLG